MPTLPQRLKLRHKLAALSVVGVAMCILPLVQVLRYQGLELQRVRSASPEQDAGLLAVSLQRGLLGHRDAAGQVLRGRSELESERRLRQVEVDTRLAMLDHAVVERGPDRALQETQDMRRDWGQLVQQVLGRRVSADASDAAHRLLVEQTLQVIDLVAGASPLLLDSDLQVARLAHALLVPLPRLTLSLSTQHDPAATAAEQHARLEREGAQVLAALQAALASGTAEQADPRRTPALGTAADDAPQSALKRALAVALAGSQSAMQQHLLLLGTARLRDKAVVASAEQALHAHLDLMTLAQASLQQTLAERVTRIQWQHGLGLGALAGLALLALLLMASVLRAVLRLERQASQHWAGAPMGANDGQSALHEAMHWLMQRARRPAVSASSPQRSETRRDA